MEFLVLLPISIGIIYGIYYYSKPKPVEQVKLPELTEDQKEFERLIVENKIRSDVVSNMTLKQLQNYVFVRNYTRGGKKRRFPLIDKRELPNDPCSICFDDLKSMTKGKK